MSIATEPDTMAELIADCAQIPPSLRTGLTSLDIAPPRTHDTPPTPAWSVDDACHAQVADLDEYV